MFFLKELQSIFPPERISTEEIVLESYASDSATPPGGSGKPYTVVLPENVREIKAILEVARRHKIPVVPMSRSSNIAGMAIPSQGGIIVDLRMMNKIIEINEDASYAVIEPGVTFHKFSLELRKRGYYCHLPTAPGGGSVIGNYLMHPSGNLAAKWDPDPIIALEVVLPTGEIIKTGSAAFEFAGWRARYSPFPDLTGLFMCSYGTLGIITKASVKIYETGEEEKLILAEFDDISQAIEFMKLIIRRNIADSATFWTWGWNLFHDTVFANLDELPEAMLKRDQKNPPDGIPFGICSAKIAGYRKINDAKFEVCCEIAEKIGGKILTDEEMKKIHPGAWEYLNTYFKSSIHKKPGEESQLRFGLHLPGCLINAEPSKIIEIENYMWKLAEKEFDPPYFYRTLPFSYGREFFFAFVVYITGPIREKVKYIQHIKGIYDKLYRELLVKYGAIMFRFRKDPTFIAKTGEYGVLLRKIKKLVDPYNIMNPGILMF